MSEAISPVAGLLHMYCSWRKEGRPAANQRFPAH